MNKDKGNRIVFWITTGLLSFMMVMSAIRYLIDYEAVSKAFIDLGYNTRIIIPLAILKILGVVAILTNKSKLLKEWAYFGFLIDYILALEAHLSIKDGQHWGAVIALILWLVSYTFGKRVFADQYQ